MCFLPLSNHLLATAGMTDAPKDQQTEATHRKPSRSMLASWTLLSACAILLYPLTYGALRATESLYLEKVLFAINPSAGWAPEPSPILTMRVNHDLFEHPSSDAIRQLFEPMIRIELSLRN